MPAGEAPRNADTAMSMGFVNSVDGADRIVVDELFLSSKPRAGGRRSIAGGTGSAWVVDDQAVGIEAVHHARLAYSVIVHNEWKRVGMIGLRVDSPALGGWSRCTRAVAR